MQILTNVIAADEEEYPAIGESSSPLEEWSGIDAPGLDTVKLAVLHSMLTGDSLQSALDRCEPIYVSADETQVLRMADELLEELAELDEEAMETLAGELAATEEFEEAQWDTDEAYALLSALAELAQLAESQGQCLFVWIFLVQEEE